MRETIEILSAQEIIHEACGICLDSVNWIRGDLLFMWKGFVGTSWKNRSYFPPYSSNNIFSSSKAWNSFFTMRMKFFQQRRIIFTVKFFFIVGNIYFTTENLFVQWGINFYRREFIFTNGNLFSQKGINFYKKEFNFTEGNLILQKGIYFYNEKFKGFYFKVKIFFHSEKIFVFPLEAIFVIEKPQVQKKFFPNEKKIQFITLWL